MVSSDAGTTQIIVHTTRICPVCACDHKSHVTPPHPVTACTFCPPPPLPSTPRHCQCPTHLSRVVRVIPNVHECESERLLSLLAEILSGPTHPPPHPPVRIHGVWVDFSVRGLVSMYPPVVWYVHGRVNRSKRVYIPSVGLCITLYTPTAHMVQTCHAHVATPNTHVLADRHLHATPVRSCMVMIKYESTLLFHARPPHAFHPPSSSNQSLNPTRHIGHLARTTPNHPITPRPRSTSHARTMGLEDTTRMQHMCGEVRKSPSAPPLPTQSNSTRSQNQQSATNHNNGQVEGQMNHIRLMATTVAVIGQRGGAPARPHCLLFRG